MKTFILRVVTQGTVSYVPSRKVEGGQTARCAIRLRELGSSYADEYVCTLFGNLAECKFAEGDLVVASLRFQVHEASANLFQDIVINDIVSLKK